MSLIKRAFTGCGAWGQTSQTAIFSPHLPLFLPFSAAPTLKNQTETAVHFARLPSTDGRRRTLTDAFSPGASICCCSEVWKESCKRKRRSDKNYFISYDGFDCENTQVTMRRLRLTPTGNHKSNISYWKISKLKLNVCVCVYICIYVWLLFS